MSRVVLVTGARGKTGREVAAQLREDPRITVRAGSSQPGGAPAANIIPVAFEWGAPETWPKAVEGADAVYLMRPDVPEAPELVAALVDLNPQAHIVLLSEQGTTQLAHDHWARRVEDAVTARAAAWTLLRPSWFHQVLTDPRFYRDSIRNDRVLSLPSGGGSIAWVDARDIAAVAVAVLRAPDRHRSKAYTLSGPQALPVAAVAAELSAYLGTPIRAEDPPVAETLDGLDSWTAGILDDLYDRVRRGEFGQLSPAIADLTGQPPTSMEQFISTHLDHWQA